MADFEIKLLNRIKEIIDTVHDAKCLVEDMNDGTEIYDVLMSKTKNLLDKSLYNLSELIILVENQSDFYILKEKLNGRL